MKKTIFLFICLLVILAGCSFNQKKNTSNSTGAFAQAVLNYNSNTKAIDVILSNPSNSAISLSYPTSNHYDFKIYKVVKHKNANIVDSNEGKMYTDVLTKIKLSPTEKLEIGTISLVKLKPGTYSIVVTSKPSNQSQITVVKTIALN